MECWSCSTHFSRAPPLILLLSWQWASLMTSCCTFHFPPCAGVRLPYGSVCNPVFTALLTALASSARYLHTHGRSLSHTEAVLFHHIAHSLVLYFFFSPKRNMALFFPRFLSVLFWLGLVLSHLNITCRKRTCTLDWCTWPWMKGYSHSNIVLRSHSTRKSIKIFLSLLWERLLKRNPNILQPCISGHMKMNLSPSTGSEDLCLFTPMEKVGKHFKKALLLVLVPSGKMVGQCSNKNNWADACRWTSEPWQH